MMRVVNVFSPTWDAYDSYGRIANEIARNLEYAGYHVNRFGDKAPEDQVVRPCTGGIFLGYPTNFEDIAAYFPLGIAGPRIAITMFESTKLPCEWGNHLNQCHTVIVPARFLVDVFRENGVQAPVEVVPLGMSPAFTEAVERRSVPEGKPFTFLAIVDRWNRKNWQGITFAFIRAFGRNRKFRLLLKSRSFPFKISNANIHCLREDYSDAQMAALYRRCQVMLFPSSGEGFGLPPREFAATGGLALATDWGGTADDLAHWGLPVPYTLTDAWLDKKDWAGQLGQWAAIDVAQLADQMKFIATHYDSYVDFGIRAAGFVRSQYRWEHFTKRVQTIWEQAVEEYSHANNARRAEAHPA